MKNKLSFKVSDFDCLQIFDCGQCFRWRDLGSDRWQGVVSGRIATVWLEGDILYIEEEGGAGDSRAFWYNYFDLGTDYGEIKRTLAARDAHLANAIQYGTGIRILRQEPFETLISFIISANNNIPRIKGCIENLCRAFGGKISGDLYSFPAPETLAALTAADISDACHTGYRSPYIVAASKQFIERGGSVADPLSYMGVGPKVAACVSLFTGSDTASFPVDVWVRRILNELYFDHEPSKTEISDFVEKTFGSYGGYAQQYLFYWRRIVDEGGI